MEALRIFETHAHYDDEAFDEDRDELLSRMEAGGIRKIIDSAKEYDLPDGGTPDVRHR